MMTEHQKKISLKKLKYKMDFFDSILFRNSAAMQYEPFSIIANFRDHHRLLLHLNLPHSQPNTKNE